jgi:membrane protein required for beta-lactamase induction
MAMTSAHVSTTGRRIARFCIWTLRQQALIALHIRIFTWSGTLLILFLALAGKISLDAALQAIVISLFSMALLIGLLIAARRQSLLHIHDPEMRERAHQAMLHQIRARRLTRGEKAWLLKKLGRRYCELGHC